MNQPCSFGEWVQVRRQSLRLTQAAVAQQVGCAVITLRKIEDDARRPSPQMAARLAAVLALPAPLHERFVQVARAERPLAALPSAHAPPTITIVRPTPLAPLPPPIPPRRTNLPAPPNGLIGRGADVATLTALVGRPEGRLVTLTGPGGVGKTRLALQVAGNLLDDFPDGVWFVDLAPLCSPDQVLPALAQVLGVALDGDVAARLQHVLAHKTILLLLDNLEHVLGAALPISGLLANAPGVSILATSRVRLHLAAERLYAVAPLAVPRHGDVAYTVADSAAVQLFVTRAQAVRHDFVLTPGYAAPVAAICQHVQGMPLAIELAAARMRLFTPQQVLARLADRLGLLVGGPRDAPARQRTLRATLDWSYHLLAPAEQQGFAQLGIFVGGWTLAAAEAVCGPDALALLEALIDASLVQRVETDTDEPRYVLLETLREYACTQLTPSATAAASHRHAQYYVALAEQGDPELCGPQQQAWLIRFMMAHHNIIAALRWCLAAGNTLLGLQLAGALCEYWDRSSLHRDALPLVEQLLAQTPTAPPLLRARALHASGLILYMKDENILARARLEESIALYYTIGAVERDAALVLFLLAVTERKCGKPARSAALLNVSLGIVEDLQDAYNGGRISFGQGLLALDHGDYDAARSLLQEAKAVFTEYGDAHYATWMYYSLGHIARATGDNALAERYYLQCANYLWQVGSRRRWGQAAICLGHIARDQGDYGRAKAIYSQGIPMLLEAGHRRYIADALDGFSSIAVATGQAAWAVELLGAAAALRTALDVPVIAVERPAYDRLLAQLQQSLDAEAFACAWALGEQRTAAQVLDLAIQECVH